MERSSLLVSRAAKLWQGRTLEGSGGGGALTSGLEGRETVARACSTGLWQQPRALLEPWILRGTVVTSGLDRGPRNRGKRVLYRALAVAARAFGPVDFVRFWTRGFFLGLEGRETVASAYSRGLCHCRRALLDPWILRGTVVTSGLEGRETLASTYSSGRHFWP